MKKLDLRENYRYSRLVRVDQLRSAKGDTWGFQVERTFWFDFFLIGNKCGTSGSERWSSAVKMRVKS